MAQPGKKASDAPTLQPVASPLLHPIADRDHTDKYMLHAAMPSYHEGEIAKERRYAELARPTKADEPHSAKDLGKAALDMHH